MTATIDEHYGRGGLGQTLLAALADASKDIEALRPADLAPIDEFHIRGAKATLELAQLAAIAPEHHVLDVGSGIGGPSRHLAAAFGCRVTGLDLSAEYCEVAAMLAARTGLEGRVDYRHGDATRMPFRGASFDVVWTQHAAMNIADKSGLYAEMARVLKPGGRLAIYDIVAGAGGEVHFPVPWATEPALSFLIEAPKLRAALEGLGLKVLHWRDATPPALDWFRAIAAKAKAQGPAPLGLHLLMGPEWGTMVANQVRNLEEDRIRLLQAVLERPA